MTAPAGSDWRTLGACVPADPDMKLFFGPDGETPEAMALRESAAKSICRPCPVRLRCLLLAIKTNAQYGVYGGLGEDDRRRTRNNELRRAAAARKEHVA